MKFCSCLPSPVVQCSPIHSARNIRNDRPMPLSQRHCHLCSVSTAIDFDVASCILSLINSHLTAKLLSNSLIWIYSLGVDISHGKVIENEMSRPTRRNCDQEPNKTFTTHAFYNFHVSMPEYTMLRHRLRPPSALSLRYGLPKGPTIP